MASEARHNAVLAARAHSDLNVFAVVASILEGSFLYRSTKSQQTAARKIIAICQAEQQICLREHDARLDDVESYSHATDGIEEKAN